LAGSVGFKAWQREVVHFMAAREQRAREEGSGDKIPPSKAHPGDLLPPTMPPPPNCPFNYKSINGSVH
jgi:hypothetical protein